ncbi:MAG: hypothetical protein ACRDDZ_12620 [Marinifilaceae bacterium]
MMRQIIMMQLLVAGIMPRLNAQIVKGCLMTEVQYDCKQSVNNCNLLRLEADVPISQFGSLNFATLHFVKTRPDRLADDLQTYSNIEEENFPCGIAVLGYSQKVGRSDWFLGVRNVNEDYFTNPAMALYTNSSCGIFPTISLNYPIANYPLSGVCVNYAYTSNQFSFKSSIYNGKGYNRFNKSDNPFIIKSKKDGVFGLLEINYTTPNENYTCGYAIHSSYVYSIENNGQETPSTTSCETGQKTPKVSSVLWAYVEKSIPLMQRQQINVLGQYSRSVKQNVYCNQYYAVGMQWQTKNRKDYDRVFGLITTVADVVDQKEIATELTYMHMISNNIVLQPAIHLIKNGKLLSHVAMLRCNIHF